MITGTYIAETINRCFDGWERNLNLVKPYDRGRQNDGTFKADNPSTPNVNEAWKTGKSPKKIVRRKSTRKKVKKND